MTAKNNILYKYKITKEKKKITNPKLFFSKFLKYCENIDFSIEPELRYIIPLKLIKNIKANKK